MWLLAGDLSSSTGGALHGAAAQGLIAGFSQASDPREKRKLQHLLCPIFGNHTPPFPQYHNITQVTPLWWEVGIIGEHLGSWLPWY